MTSLKFLHSEVFLIDKQLIWWTIWALYSPVFWIQQNKEKNLENLLTSLWFQQQEFCLLFSGSCAELVSMPTNEPSSLIVDSWLRTPIRAPSLQPSVHVYDLKHMNVLLTRLQLAVSAHAWRISLPSGCSNMFRCCAGADENRLCHEGHPGQGSVWFDLRLAEMGRVEAGKALSLQKTMLLVSQILCSLTHFKQAKGYGSKNSRGKITVYYSYLSIFSFRLSLNSQHELLPAESSLRLV